MIVGPRPQVAVETLDEIESYIQNNEIPPSALVHQFKRKAEQLLQTSEPLWGWVTLGAIAAAEWDGAGALSIASRSSSQFGRNPLLAANLSVTFKHLNLPAEAVRYSKIAHEGEPANAHFLVLHCDDLLLLGRVSEALATTQKFLNRFKTTELQAKGEALRKLVLRSLQALEAGKVSEHQLQVELGSALKVLHESRMRYESIQISEQRDPEGGSSVVVEIEFVGTIKDEIELGAQLAPLLVMNPTWDPCKLSIDFRYAAAHADLSA